jgi:hypothetical protein
MLDVDQLTPEQCNHHVAMALSEAIALLLVLKGEARSEQARHYAIVITDLEKVSAYVQTFIIAGGTHEQSHPKGT